MEPKLDDDTLSRLKSAALAGVHPTLLDEFHTAHLACFRLKDKPNRIIRNAAKRQEIAHQEALLTKDATYAYLFLYNALSQFLTKEGLETPPLEKAPHHNQPRDKGTEIVESILEDCLSAAHAAAKSNPERASGASRS